VQLSPLVIALQGIGFGPLATALQGFVDVAQEPIDPDRLPFYTPAPGGPGSQMSRRQLLQLRRRRRERKAFAAGIF